MNTIQAVFFKITLLLEVLLMSVSGIVSSISLEKDDLQFHSNVPVGEISASIPPPGKLDYTAGGVYKNRIETGINDEFGDPYIMRFNGKYYLYPSGAGGKAMFVYVSADLVYWSFGGQTVFDERFTDCSYAPEVKYYNGTFYMVTSPKGGGHYILTSSSPTGPFEAVTDNFGKAIDGSMFIDDNDRGYFYYANENGIRVVSLNSLGTMNSDRGNRLTATSLKGWTEGPCVIKRNGFYFITYTGNHLMSKGYRVAYAVSRLPNAGFVRVEDEPLIISTAEGHRNLGHSSSFLAPDLDGYCITYHDLIDWPGDRGFSIDRLVFNGDRMYALGPTAFEQPVQRMPDIYENGYNAENFVKTGNFTLLNASPDEQYTAEFNLTNFKGKSIVLGYRDTNNFYEICWTDNSRLTLSQTIDGKKCELNSCSMKAEYIPEVLHTLRIVSDGCRYEIYFDNMLKLSGKQVIASGRAGFLNVADTDIKTTAVSRYAFGDSDNDAVKSVPSSFAAINFNAGSADLEKVQSRAFAKLQTNGQFLSYQLNAQGGEYALFLKIPKAADNFKIALFVNGVFQRVCDSKYLTLNKIAGEELTKVNFGSFSLPAGVSTLSLQLYEGNVKIDEISIAKKDSLQPYAMDENPAEQFNIIGDSAGYTYSTTLKANGANTVFLSKNIGYTDMTLEATLKLTPFKPGAIILAGVSNAAVFEEKIGNSLIGYGVKVTGSTISLIKYNYDKTATLKSKVVFSSGETTVKVLKRGNWILAYINNKLYIKHYDSCLIKSGGYGLYLNKNDAGISAFKASS